MEALASWSAALTFDAPILVPRSGVIGSKKGTAEPGEVLAFQNIERQAHALRAPAPGEDDLEGGRMTGVGTPGSRKDDFEGPDDGVVLPDQVLTLSLAVTVERIDGGKLAAPARRGPTPW